MSQVKILVIDDEQDFRHMLVVVLRGKGYEVEEAASGEKGLELARTRTPDLILLDLYLPDISGLEVLEQIARLHPTPLVIIMTGQGDIKTAVRAMQLGAVDYILKPFDQQRLLSAVRSLLGRAETRAGSLAKRVVGQSPEIQDVWSQIMCYAFPDVSILLLGESGTGKELFARAIHEKSKRHEEPFVALDCASLPDTLVESEIFGHEKGAFTGALERRLGRFELAQRGTLFLDEIGNLPNPIQAKLLRVLQERQVNRLGGNRPVAVDVRIISATSLDLEQAIRKGAFREDLFYRLAEVLIHLPPLRERQGDVEVLTEHFLEKFNKTFGREVRGISDPAWKIIRQYRWPGNVRELENAIKSSLLAAEDSIESEHLPEYLRRGLSESFNEVAAGNIKERVRRWIDEGVRAGFMDLKALAAECAEEIERDVLEELLKSRRFTQAELSTFLNIDPKTLRSRLQKFGLSTR